MMRRIGTFLALGLGALVGMAQTTSGRLSGTEVWSGEVRLTGDITIPFGGSLTIQPGTKVLMATSDDTESGSDPKKIRIHVAGGTFTAVGTEASKIDFLSAAEIPQNGQWYGIVCDLGNVEIRHARIGHATRAIRYVRPGFYELNDTEIYDYSDRVIWIEASGRYSFEGIRIRSARGVGVYGFYNSGASFLEFKDWHISGGSRGIYVATSESTITDTVIEGNTLYGIWTDGGKLSVSNCTVSGGTRGIVDNSPLTELSIRGCRFFNATSSAINSTSVRAEIRDSEFRGNESAVILGGGAHGGAIEGGTKVTVRGNTFEGNQKAAISIPANSRNRTWNPISRLADISSNAFRVNGIGFATELSVPEGVLVDNDFIMNGVDVVQGGMIADTSVVANGNYWGDIVTQLLDSGEDVSAINAISGNVVVDDWATSSRLEAVEPPPSPIEWENGDWGVTVGETATISLTLEKGDSYDYQWFKDGVVVQGATGPSLEIRNASLADAGRYIVVVSNEAGSVTSEPAVLSVSADPANVPAGNDSFHPADSNKDSRISIDEVTAYGAAWKNGRDWPGGPNPIPIDYLTRAGALWKNGERYRKDANVASAPLWWVNDSGAGRAQAAERADRDAGNFVRLSIGSDLPRVERRISEQGPEVQLLVTPPRGTGVWAFEGLGLKEGPFLDSEPREFTLKAEQDVGMLLLSVDGDSILVGLGSQPGAERLEAVRLDGRFGLRPVGVSGPYRLEFSRDLVEWTPAVLVGEEEGTLFPFGSQDGRSSFFRLRSVGARQ